MSRPATLQPVKPDPFQPDSQKCASKGPLSSEYGCRRSSMMLPEAMKATNTRRQGVASAPRKRFKFYTTRWLAKCDEYWTRKNHSTQTILSGQPRVQPRATERHNAPSALLGKSSKRIMRGKIANSFSLLPAICGLPIAMAVRAGAGTIHENQRHEPGSSVER